MNENKINFDSLVSQIEYTNEALQNNARLIINRHVTAKAWLTGYYIVEYEQNGSDRAKYGEKLIIELAKRLKTNGDNKCSKRSLELYRTFYITYRNLAEPIQQYIVKNFSIAQSPIAQLENYGNQENAIAQSLLAYRQRIVWQSSCVRRMKNLQVWRTTHEGNER